MEDSITKDLTTVRTELQGTVDVWADCKEPHWRAQAARSALEAFDRIQAEIVRLQVSELDDPSLD